MGHQSAAQEPSMEEILASIRRIISDEETGSAPAAPAAAPEPAEDPDEAFEAAAVEEDDLDQAFEVAEAEPSTEEEDAFAAFEVEPEAQENADDGFDEDPMAAFEPEPSPEPEPEAEKDDGVLELTPDLAIDTSVEAPALVEVDDDVDFADPAPPEPEPDLVAEPLIPPAPRMEDPPLLSEPANAAASAAFNSLANTILSHNARTLEDLVQDMLRPMLKAWLDENLPATVERLVQAEIERVSRGGR